jgi:hypothetical protein
LAAHYQQWVAEHPTDDIYAYVIYATSLVSSIGISVLTEQGLKQVASDYKNKHGYTETLDQLECDLRWSVADTPYCGDIQEIFEPVNARLQSMMAYVDSLEVDDPAFSTHIETLYTVLVAALLHLRHTELQDRMRPMLYVDFGDMSDEERVWFIEQCNDEEVVESYRSSLESAG